MSTDSSLIPIANNASIILTKCNGDDNTVTQFCLIYVSSCIYHWFPDESDILTDFEMSIVLRRDQSRRVQELFNVNVRFGKVAFLIAKHSFHFPFASANA